MTDLKVDLLHEQASNDGSLSATGLRGSEQLREPFAQVVHLAVQASDVVAGLLQDLGCRHLCTMKGE